MNYQCDLPGGQLLSVENSETQTRIALNSGGHGQQQSQANSFQTGAWTHPPALFQTSRGLVLQIEAAQGRFYFQLQGSSVHRLDDAPTLRDAETLHLQKTSAGDADSKPTMTPLQPMESMEPMKPMRPMQMRMGNMHMSMGTPPSQTERPAPEHPAPERHASEHPAPLQSGGEISPQPEISSRRFCTQCGREAAAADRFCARCGHELVPLDESAA